MYLILFPFLIQGQPYRRKLNPDQTAEMIKIANTVFLPLLFLI